MANIILTVLILLLSICFSEQHQSSNAKILLKIKFLLNYPSVLSSWNTKTDFCNIEPTQSLTVTCYEESITQIHIIGNEGNPPLPLNFSIDSFVRTLSKLQTIKVLTLVSLGLWGPLPRKIARLSSLEILNMSSNFLYDSIPNEISYLTNMQTLILDRNMFSGHLVDSVGSMSALSVLSIRNNSLNGTLPESLGRLENLRVISLAHNQLSGEVPDLGSLVNLQVLDLDGNFFGPQFPNLCDKLVTLVLRNNKFGSGIPKELTSCYQLEKLDVSLNRLVGPFPLPLLSLPSIKKLDISGNRLTGMLYENLSCNSELEFVNFSSNLLTGGLPSCFQSLFKDGIGLYSNNCLSTGDLSQLPLSFCQIEALAVGPDRNKSKHPSRGVLAMSIVLGIVGGIILVGFVFLFARKVSLKMPRGNFLQRSSLENASSTGYSSKVLADTRYISQAMKIGALCLPAYRTFSLEELELATNNFDTSNFVGEGSHGQIYRGQLKDGSVVAIRCVKTKRRQGTQSFMHHIDLIWKLRHKHLVSALGHCFECYLDDATVSRMFIIFEYVPNGTLRSWVSEGCYQRKLTWSQRIAAVTGVAKGIQFLHTGIVPGVFTNNLKITDILMDQNLVAKISGYNLALLSGSLIRDGIEVPSGARNELKPRERREEKSDMYGFGVILLEVLLGRPINSKREIDVAKYQLQICISAEGVARRSIVDPAIQYIHSEESLKTVMEICIRCLHKNTSERPLIDDVLWNLQFAAQVHDAQSNDGSPISSFNPTLVRQ
ncbi:probable inactive leucine-rich repeat receptor-like protein kinase At3g03770 isoform X2 [Impatiens glandulifera]|uniref:probable inactive leucine-rich repeat receptor-like protein kinase At3g03770 isoform X2 n=1 Tax=Impatiens glandulifera TaxID=253017 RepID=UPI001FB0B2F0|nr:probable inactive leucine-rich repeat receptor-like protein kinase At3g03770 isoform X2 [Impatiens glandulifera]